MGKLHEDSTATTPQLTDGPTNIMKPTLCRIGPDLDVLWLQIHGKINTSRGRMRVVEFLQLRQLFVEYNTHTKLPCLLQPFEVV